MDHNKITEKRNRAAEELRKKQEAKNKKAGIKSNVNPSTMSQGALRMSNLAGTMRATITANAADERNMLTSSIINDRDSKMSYRDAQYLNPDSRLYRQVKY
jgi:hypothetical protein